MYVISAFVLYVVFLELMFFSSKTWKVHNSLVTLFKKMEQNLKSN